jgi:CBS-domain-containing membrane protein
LAQPRNSFFGQLIAVTIGVSIAKLFALSPHFDSIRWIGGALACATATAAMALTKTVHPPAGATALLAVVDHVAFGLGWMLIPVVLVGCVIMLGMALLVNNIQSRYPSYWWTPETLQRPASGVGEEEKEDLERQRTGSTWQDEGDVDGVTEIVIRKGVVIVRGRITVDGEEKAFLETLSDRL